MGTYSPHQPWGGSHNTWVMSAIAWYRGSVTSPPRMSLFQTFKHMYIQRGMEHDEHIRSGIELAATDQPLVNHSVASFPGDASAGQEQYPQWASGSYRDNHQVRQCGDASELTKGLTQLGNSGIIGSRHSLTVMVPTAYNNKQTNKRRSDYCQYTGRGSRDIQQA